MISVSSISRCCGVTYMDEVDDVYMPAPKFPAPPFFVLHLFTSKDVFMMQHSKQEEDGQKLV